MKRRHFIGATVASAATLAGSRICAQAQSPAPAWPARPISSGG